MSSSNLYDILKFRNFFFNSLLLFQLSNILKLKNQILKPLKNRLNHFSLAPFLFGDSKLGISLVSHQTFMRFIKKAMFSETVIRGNKAKF